MAWTAPTNGTFDPYAIFAENNPGVAPTSANILKWLSEGGQQELQNAYGAGWTAWNDLISANDPGTLDLSSITNWTTGQLEGTEDNPTGGIYDFMTALQNEMAGGAGQYQQDWSKVYATMAGFETPEARDAYLQQQRDLQAQFQGGMQAPQLTAEQQKAVRAQAAETEARSRKQAEAMFQETGSYAVLQRASDELSRANVNDQFKQTMELERENFARALSGVNQQTEIIMREVESGERSFAFYVEAKQRGVAAALQGWSDRAALVLQESQLKQSTATAEYQSEVDAWQREADAIHRAAVIAMGGDENFMNYYSQWVDSLAVVDEAARAMEEGGNSVGDVVGNIGEGAAALGGTLLAGGLAASATVAGAVVGIPLAIVGAIIGAIGLILGAIFGDT